uniref:vomeronasal type-1 receptor 3-like n=1 Tax=Jaculus jaculus TaxID=51337 RepID=UPI001E1B2928|nr:vomeronasal type-1 receptor 3-like [Jaculus jaculus]
MFPSDMVLGIFLTSEFCIGFIGNSLFFLYYVYIFLDKHYLKKSTDAIVMHLTIVNTLTIVFLLIPDIASSFGVRRLLNDAGCKAVLYIHRVTRGLSICTTSFLSTFQAITISPSNSKWAWLKPKLSTWIFPSFFLFLVINMLIYIHLIHTVIARNNDSHAVRGYIHAFCKNIEFRVDSWQFFFVLLTRDLFFVVLMMSTSLYMVNLLFRHHRRTQHVHSQSLSSQPSPETKATHSILLLVICFVFFYWLSNIVTIYRFYTSEKILRLEGVNAILSSCYPAMCPFILMRNKKIILKFSASNANLTPAPLRSVSAAWLRAHLCPTWQPDTLPRRTCFPAQITCTDRSLHAEA